MIKLALPRDVGLGKDHFKKVKYLMKRHLYIKYIINETESCLCDIGDGEYIE